MGPRPGTLIRYAAVADVPWRNGGGRTRQLRASGDWRLSVATISDAGRFSAVLDADRGAVRGDGALVALVSISEGQS